MKRHTPFQNVLIMNLDVNSASKINGLGSLNTPQDSYLGPSPSRKMPWSIVISLFRLHTTQSPRFPIHYSLIRFVYFLIHAHILPSNCIKLCIAKIVKTSSLWEQRHPFILLIIQLQHLEDGDMKHER